jgi:hypothetical protein
MRNLENRALRLYGHTERMEEEEGRGERKEEGIHEDTCTEYYSTIVHNLFEPSRKVLWHKDPLIGN